MQEKHKNDNLDEKRPKLISQLLFGLSIWLWLTCIAILQIPLYKFLSRNINDNQTVMGMTATLFVTLYILGIVYLIHHFIGRNQANLKNDDVTQKQKQSYANLRAAAALYLFLFLWLGFTLMLFLFGNWLLSPYLDELELPAELLAMPTLAFYLSGALFIMYYLRKSSNQKRPII